VTKQILVYGSLRKGQGANYMLRGCEFVEEVRLPGYDLFNLVWYPGIKQNVDNKEGVVGEVYRLPDDDKHTLAGLDLYEGYVEFDPPSSLFLREEVLVNGEPTFVYTYNGKNVGDKIPSGDWVEYHKVEHLDA
jgi:gamma-glutamylcyclotransferase (GGCT)/AIG2-like uncharacterized protein YtfP